MAEELLDFHSKGFADGGSGHVYTFGKTIPEDPSAGAPNVGEWDLLFINSNTTVSTPSGFTSLNPVVNQQGVYWFGREAVGGETDSVTITTNGNHNVQLSWSRWSGLDAFATGSSAQANNSNGTALPDSSTGTLPASGLLMLVGGALHNFDGALATSPNWSDGFTGIQTGTQGAAGSSQAVVGFTGYKSGVGTASEPVDVVTWTNAARNRYATWVTFSVTAGGATDLTVGDATHGHTAEQPTLTQAHALTAADAAHAHGAEQPALTQVHVIVAQDATHAHTAEQPALTQTHLLVSADATHGHTAEQPALTQAHVLLAADASHAHLAEQPALSQVHALTAADALHGHLADSPALTQLHTVVAADATHGHTADQASLAGASDIAVNDAGHAHSAENATVAQTHALSVADALHGHLAELAALTQLHQLVAADARHAHTADNGTVSPPVVPGILRAGFTRPRLTPGRLPSG